MVKENSDVKVLKKLSKNWFNGLVDNLIGNYCVFLNYLNCLESFQNFDFFGWYSG